MSFIHSFFIVSAKNFFVILWVHTVGKIKNIESTSKCPHFRGFVVRVRTLPTPTSESDMWTNYREKKELKSLAQYPANLVQDILHTSDTIYIHLWVSDDDKTG